MKSYTIFFCNINSIFNHTIVMFSSLFSLPLHFGIILKQLSQFCSEHDVSFHFQLPLHKQLLRVWLSRRHGGKVVIFHSYTTVWLALLVRTHCHRPRSTLKVHSPLTSSLPPFCHVPFKDTFDLLDKFWVVWDSFADLIKQSFTLQAWFAWVGHQCIYVL